MLIKHTTWQHLGIRKVLIEVHKEQATVIFHGIVRNHTFQNGNKRTALAAFRYFTRKNNIQVNLSDNQLLDIATSIENEKINDIKKVIEIIFDSSS